MKNRILFVLLLVNALLAINCGSRPSVVNRAETENQYEASKRSDSIDIVEYYATENAIRKLIANYDAVANANPVYQKWLGQASCYCALKDYKKALSLTDSAEAHSEDAFEVLHIQLKRGYILEDSGNKTEAALYYEKALQGAQKQNAQSANTLLSSLIDMWECLMATYDADVAAEYFLEQLRFIENMDEKDKDSWSLLATKSIYGVMGREWYIHCKAAGVYVVSESEMAEIRFLKRFSNSFKDKLKEETPNIQELTKTFFSDELQETVSKNDALIFGIAPKNLQTRLPITIGIIKEKDSGWYKLRLTDNDYEYDIKVGMHVAHGDKTLRIDNILI